MNILAVVHGDLVGPAIFSQVIEECCHEFECWYPASRADTPRPLEAYEAGLVFGGVMDAHEEARHPWLRKENSGGDAIEHRPDGLAFLRYTADARAYWAGVGERPGSEPAQTRALL